MYSLLVELRGRGREFYSTIKDEGEKERESAKEKQRIIKVRYCVDIPFISDTKREITMYEARTLAKSKHAT